MALLFADTGGANYNTATLPQFWGVVVGSPVVEAGLDGSCISGPAGTWAVGQTTVVPVGTQSNIGFACSINRTIFSPRSPILEVVGNTSTLDLFLYVSADGTLEASQPGGAGIICFSSPGAFTFNTRQYVEFAYQYVTGTNISVVLYVNGTLVAGNNIPASFQTTGQVYWGDLNDQFGGDIQFGTFYVNDSTTSFCNTVLGNTYMNLYLPNAEGRVDTWTPFGDSPNYNCVNNAPPLGDGQYNYTSTVNNADCYAIPAPPGTLSSIKGVVSMANIRMDVAGSRSVAVGLGNGSTESYGSGNALTTSYTTYRQNFSSNPFTSAAWLTTDINTLQAAVKVTA
jgi:hypothetical protein